jgi:short subunit dehydrogenase-like uncharacterized protein
VRAANVNTVSERDLDVVVLGATGVTGRRVAAYLAERATGHGVRWAAAARDAGKLERLLDEIGVRAPETITADVADADSLAALAARSRVVLDLVGPYTLYGRPVIEACVGNGAHYVDLTGEIQFVRGIIHDYNGRAVAAGVKIVQVCGFEALPADLMSALAAERARELWDEGLASVDLEVAFAPPPGRPRATDMMSGGTFQSLTAVTAAEDAAVITDPAALIDDPVAADAVRSISPIAIAPRRGSSGAVLAPMGPAAFINPAVIHRSAVLIAAAAGRAVEPFRYREGTALEGGPVSLPGRWALAGALWATQTGVRTLARASPTIRRPLAAAMARIGPSSGVGPAAERLEGWGWKMEVRAYTRAGHELRVHLQAEGHPGYLATARLLGEAGLLLAEDGATPAQAGCLTPAAALGTGCIEGFAHARLRFTVGVGS